MLILQIVGCIAAIGTLLLMLSVFEMPGISNVRGSKTTKLDGVASIRCISVEFKLSTSLSRCTFLDVKAEGYKLLGWEPTMISAKSAKKSLKINFTTYEGMKSLDMHILCIPETEVDKKLNLCVSWKMSLFHGTAKASIVL